MSVVRVVEGNVTTVVNVPKPSTASVQAVSNASAAKVTAIGLMGREGPQGPAGPAGNGVSSYIHNQVTPSSEWTVVHNLGYRPGGITVLDTAGDEWKGKIEHIDENSYKISFGAASFAGVVYNS